MLKALFEHIQNTASAKIETIKDTTYIITRDGEYDEIVPDVIAPDTLGLNSLDALVKMVRTEALKLSEGPVYIEVMNHNAVRCFENPDLTQRMNRCRFYDVTATDIPGWGEKVELGFEEAQIAIRTRFQESRDTEYLLKLLSDISVGAKCTFNDNGIATNVVTSKGISLQQNQAIKPIVSLRPYRTFQEVEQPESLFLIRVSERSIKFIEADGGMWKLKARQTVKEFLENALKDEVESGHVVVML